MEDATSMIRRVMGLYSIDITTCHGVEISHSVRIGWCHYPTECSTFEDLWRQALVIIKTNLIQNIRLVGPTCRDGDAWTTLHVTFVYHSLWA